MPRTRTPRTTPRRPVRNQAKAACAAGRLAESSTLIESAARSSPAAVLFFSENVAPSPPKKDLYCTDASWRVIDLRVFFCVRCRAQQRLGIRTTPETQGRVQRYVEVIRHLCEKHGQSSPGIVIQAKIVAPACLLHAKALVQPWRQATHRWRLQAWTNQSPVLACTRPLFAYEQRMTMRLREAKLCPTTTQVCKGALGGSRAPCPPKQLGTPGAHRAPVYFQKQI